MYRRAEFKYRNNWEINQVVSYLLPFPEEYQKTLKDDVIREQVWSTRQESVDNFFPMLVHELMADCRRSMLIHALFGMV